MDDSVSKSSLREVNYPDGSRELQDHSPGKWFSNWEEQCLLEVGSDTSETTLSTEQSEIEQKLWMAFQNTASAIAQLYKDRAQSHDELWVSFQNAAEYATNMYRDGVEGSRSISELALQCGYHRRNKELLSWAKKKRRHIRREDLIGYLCGRSPPHRSSKPSSSLSKSQDGSRDNRMQMFHDAVSMNGLNGAMAGISFGGDSPLTSSARSCQGFHPDLTTFISEEFQRRNLNSGARSGSPPRKRAAASQDSKPPSPKRRK